MIDLCFRPSFNHFETKNFRYVEFSDISSVCRTSRKVIEILNSFGF